MGRWESFYFSLDSRRQWTGIKAKHRAGVIVLRADKIHEGPRSTGANIFFWDVSLREISSIFVTLCGINIVVPVGIFANGRLWNSKWPSSADSRYQMTSIMKLKIAIDLYHCPIFLIERRETNCAAIMSKNATAFDIFSTYDVKQLTQLNYPYI